MNSAEIADAKMGEIVERPTSIFFFSVPDEPEWLLRQREEAEGDRNAAVSIAG